jgi:hypothetical protein
LVLLQSGMLHFLATQMELFVGLRFLAILCWTFCLLFFLMLIERILLLMSTAQIFSSFSRTFLSLFRPISSPDTMLSTGLMPCFYIYWQSPIFRVPLNLHSLHSLNGKVGDHHYLPDLVSLINLGGLASVHIGKLLTSVAGPD